MTAGNSAPPDRLPAGAGAVVPVPETKGKNPPAYKEEKDIHRHALEYYYLLGKERTLEKVAEKYGAGLDTVQKWSSSFGWKERVRAFEERRFAIEFETRVSRIMDMALFSMTEIEKETGREVLSKDYSAEKLKTLCQVRAIQREEQRKGDPGPPNSGNGPDSPTKGSAKGKKGTMVTANFT